MTAETNKLRGELNAANHDQLHDENKRLVEAMESIPEAGEIVGHRC